MSQQPTAQEAAPFSIQLLVEGESDRRALTTFLEERYEIVTGDTIQPADCYVLGEQMFLTHRDELEATKRAAHPTFTPALLLKQAGSKATVPLPTEQSEDGPPLIDEVISAPVNSTTLYRRLENLKARRKQSIELANRYEAATTRFQRLFDAANDAIFVVGPDGEEITECNPAACELVGYTRHELLSASPLETVFRLETERFQTFLQTVTEYGHGSTDVLTCQTKQDETRRLEVSAAAIEESEESNIILSVRDVTERKESQLELELQSRAMDEAPVGITITDPGQDDNPLVYVNDGFEEITGYSEAEALGRNCRFLQGPETRAAPIRQIREAIEKQHPVSVELRNYRKDGSQFWNRVSIAPVRDDDGTVLNYVGFQEDISDRKERELDLELYRKALANAGRSVFITNSDGIITYVNAVFEAQTGYTAEEAIGRTPRILKSGKQPAAFYERLWETILAGNPWEATLINKRKNGELYHAEQSITPIADDTGEITHFVSIENDMTNRRLREQQLDVLNRVLRHNLRNDTNVIQGYAQLIRESTTDEELQASAETITNKATALAQLSDKAQTIRSLFESEIPAESAYDLKSFLPDVIEEFTESHPDASVSVGTIESISIHADSRLQLAVTELLENAFEYTDQPSPTVTVSAEATSQNDSGDWAKIEIADNGPGIPENERATLESGEETSLRHGSGLGLWIVYWTVSLFGGEVNIEDNVPRGTRVELLLPRA